MACHQVPPTSHPKLIFTEIKLFYIYITLISTRVYNKCRSSQNDTKLSLKYIPGSSNAEPSRAHEHMQWSENNVSVYLYYTGVDNTYHSFDKVFVNTRYAKLV